MSAQPLRVARTEPYVQIEHSLIDQLGSVCNGHGMWVLLTQIMKAANYRARDGSYTGWVVLSSTYLADKALMLRHTLNAQIRVAVEWGLIARMELDDAVAAGAITQADADEELNGYAYRVLVENWPAVAEMQRQRFLEAQDAKEAKPKPQEAPKGNGVEWAAAEVAPGETREVQLGHEGKKALGTCGKIEFVSMLADPVQHEMHVLDGKLIITARQLGASGKYIYRPVEATESTPVNPALSAIVSPMCLELCGQKADLRLLQQTSANLQGCPITGRISFETSIHRIVRDLQAKRKPVKPGIFPYAAREACENWLERQEHEEFKRRQEADQALAREKALAQRILDNASGHEPEDVEWAHKLLGLRH